MAVKKIKRKTIITILTTTFVIASTIVFYFLFIKKTPQESWYDSNWSYRRNVYINDIPKEYTELTDDVLIQIDTETLISEKKLNSNCSDIRFIDEDNSSSLQYWIEGGCNTKETQIWTKVKFSNTSEKTIYMYYGNEKAPDAQEPWNGEFFSMTLDNCSGNWASEKDFSGNFIMSKDVFGYNGGVENHNHSLFQYSDINCDDPVKVAISEDYDNCNPNQDNIISSTTNSFSNIPPYENLNFCSSRNGYLTSSSIMLLNTNTPDGFEHVSILDGKYPRGNNNENLEVNTNHIHEISCVNKQLPTSDRSQRYLSLGENSKTIVTQTEPSFYNMNFVTKPSAGSIPVNGIMMVSSVPPLGWEYFSEAEDRLLKGSSRDFGSTGGEDSHYHVMNLPFSIKTTSISNLSNIKTGGICLLNNSDINDPRDFSEENILPPYITALLVKKKDGLVGTLTIDFGLEEDTEEVLGIGSGPSQPTELETEGQTNPGYIIDTTPEFTAKFNHPDYP